MSNTQDLEVIENGEADDTEQDVCLQCNSRRKDERRAFRLAARKVALLTAVCCVLCALTITACCCSLYIYYRFQGFRQDLVAMVKMNNQEAGEILAGHFKTDENTMAMYGESDYSEEYEDFVDEQTDRIRRRSKNKNRAERQKGDRPSKNPKRRKCKKKQMKLCECCKETLTKHIAKQIKDELKNIKNITKDQKTTIAPIPVSTPQPGNAQKNEFSYVAAAHYTTYVNEEYIGEMFGPTEDDYDRHKPKNASKDMESDEEMFLYIPDWQGTLYRNRTFITNAAPSTFRFFQEAEWMANLTAEKKIFDFDSTTGRFQAKYTGLYQLYAHVLFYDVNSRVEIGLMHERKKGLPGGSKVVLRCVEGLDQDEKKLTGYNHKYKSCSVNGALYLKEGDIVAVQSLHKNTCLDLTNEVSYFGGILFSLPNT